MLLKKFCFVKKEKKSDDDDDMLYIIIKILYTSWKELSL